MFQVERDQDRAEVLEAREGLEAVLTAGSQQAEGEVQAVRAEFAKLANDVALLGSSVQEQGKQVGGGFLFSSFFLFFCYCVIFFCREGRLFGWCGLLASDCV